MKSNTAALYSAKLCKTNKTSTVNSEPYANHKAYLGKKTYVLLTFQN